jgi:hypothetical protein
MSFFDYNDGVPATNDNPSVDQPSMLTNTLSIEGIWEVDHYGFKDNNGGIHQQTTFPAFASPAVPGNPMASVAYPAAGVSDINHPQYYFQTNQNNFPLTLIRAYGAFETLATPGAITPYTQSNVTGTIAQASSTGNTTFTINLSTNAVASDNVAVLITTSSSNGFAYFFNFASGVGKLVISIGSGLPPVQQISFAILQL